MNNGIMYNDAPSMQGDSQNIGDESIMDGNDAMMDDGQMDSDDDVIMGSKPFGDTDESSSDPEKKVESLIGKAASILRKDLSSDGINKHIDKKKEVLGMLVSAIVNGMDDEHKNEITDYLSDKLKTDSSNDSEESLDNDDNSDNEQLSESIANNIVNELMNLNKSKKTSSKSLIDQPSKKEYGAAPYTMKK